MCSTQSIGATGIPTNFASTLNRKEAPAWQTVEVRYRHGYPLELRNRTTVVNHHVQLGSQLLSVLVCADDTAVIIIANFKCCYLP